MGQEGADEHGMWTGSCRGAPHLQVRLRHSGAVCSWSICRDKAGHAGCHGVRWTVTCSCSRAPGRVEAGGLVTDCSGFQPSVPCSLTLLCKADTLIAETGMTQLHSAPGGIVGHSRASQGITGHSRAWWDMAGHSRAWRGMARHRRAWEGMAGSHC